MSIGKAIKEQRMLKDKTLIEIEKATGITNQTLSNWENNKYIDKIIMLIKLADYYEVSLDELVGRDFPPAGTVYYKSAVNNKLGNNSKIEIK